MLGVSKGLPGVGVWSRLTRWLLMAVTFVAFGVAAGNAVGAVAWTIQPLPPGPNGALNGVSCSSITFGMAVGYQAGPLGDVPLVYRFDGVSWSLQATPYPPPTQAGSQIELTGVSCTSRSACTAVGYAD